MLFAKSACLGCSLRQVINAGLLNGYVVYRGLCPVLQLTVAVQIAHCARSLMLDLLNEYVVYRDLCPVPSSDPLKRSSVSCTEVEGRCSAAGGGAMDVDEEDVGREVGCEEGVLWTRMRRMWVVR